MRFSCSFYVILLDLLKWANTAVYHKKLIKKKSLKTDRVDILFYYANREHFWLIEWHFFAHLDLIKYVSLTERLSAEDLSSDLPSLLAHTDCI